MNLKFKLVSALLSIVLLAQYSSIIAFAEQTEINTEKSFRPDDVFSEYVSYENIKWGRFFSVSNSNEQNTKAIFDEEKQVTDFIYDSITSDIFGYSFIVTQNINGVKTYGALDFKYFDEKNYENNPEIEYRLPIKYKSIEYKSANSNIVLVAENFDGTEEYYLDKQGYLNDKSWFKSNKTYDIEYTDCGKLIKINSLNDVPNPTANSDTKKTPIEGLDNCYIMDDGSGFYVNIVDKDGNKLIDNDFREVDNKLSPGETILVWYPEGMQDSSGGLLNKDLEIIVPRKGYFAPSFIELDGKIYIKAKKISGEPADYYDLDGNIIDDPQKNANNNTQEKEQPSKWAEESISQAINAGIVLDDLQSKYSSKITRKEFCQIAIKAYAVKMSKDIDMTASSPFDDINDPYITAAYNMKIVSGMGNNKFAPDNNITRQEAAVMLNNLAVAFNIKPDNLRLEKFDDENSFANWAKDAIYTVSSIKSGDTYVMAGMGNNKFAPLINYTREQAISTIWRLFII